MSWREYIQAFPAALGEGFTNIGDAIVKGVHGTDNKMIRADNANKKKVAEKMADPNFNPVPTSADPLTERITSHLNYDPLQDGPNISQEMIDKITAQRRAQILDDSRLAEARQWDAYKQYTAYDMDLYGQKNDIDVATKGKLRAQEEPYNETAAKRNFINQNMSDLVRNQAAQQQATAMLAATMMGGR